MRKRTQLRPQGASSSELPMIAQTVLLAFLLLMPAAFADGVPHIRLVPFAGGLNIPLALVDDGSGRLFAVEQAGTIRLVTGGQVESQPGLILPVVFTAATMNAACSVLHFIRNSKQTDGSL